MGARRANAMREVGARLGVNVLVNFPPVVAVVANLFAVHANGKKPFQLLHPGQGRLQIIDSVRQVPLQINDALAGSHPGNEFGSIARLPNKIVSSARQGARHIFLSIPCGNDDEVNITSERTAAHGATHVQPRPFRQHPIEQCKRWSIGIGKQSECFISRLHREDFKTFALEQSTQRLSCLFMIFSDYDSFYRIFAGFDDLHVRRRIACHRRMAR